MCFGMEAKRSMFYILSLTLVSGILSWEPDPITICPPSELIEPCVCSQVFSGGATDVVCEHIGDQEVLSRVFTSEYQFQTFSLKYSSVLFMPDSLYEVQRLAYLYIGESSLVTLFNSTEENFIRAVDLEKVRIIRGFNWKMISGFLHLEKISFREMSIAKIDQSFVDHVPKTLDEFIISDCSTATIHDKAFASLPELQYMKITHGKIKEVKRSMFPASTKLELFDFSWNRLSSLPENIFSEMPRLRQIALQGNLLTEMLEKTFRPVFLNLNAFTLDDNPLKCRCNIRWITNVYWGFDMPPIDFHGVCQDPKNLHGRKIKDLVPEDFFHCI